MDFSLSDGKKDNFYVYSCQTSWDLYCHSLFCARCDDEKKNNSVFEVEKGGKKFVQGLGQHVF